MTIIGDSWHGFLYHPTNSIKALEGT